MYRIDHTYVKKGLINTVIINGKGIQVLDDTVSNEQLKEAFPQTYRKITKNLVKRGIFTETGKKEEKKKEKEGE
jgi:hypothetical protein